MKTLLVVLGLTCCITKVNAQDIDLFLLHAKIAERNPTPVEFVGMSLMSVGGCVVGVESYYTQAPRGKRGNAANFSGTVLMVSGFVTYIVGSIRFREQEQMRTIIKNQ